MTSPPAPAPETSPDRTRTVSKEAVAVLVLAVAAAGAVYLATRPPGVQPGGLPMGTCGSCGGAN